MKSHDLARLLLTLPDLPVATYTHGHVYNSEADASSHGSLKVGLLAHYASDAIVIGNISERNINVPNWYVLELYHGKAPNMTSYMALDHKRDWIFPKSYAGKTVPMPDDEPRYSGGSVGPRCKP